MVSDARARPDSGVGKLDRTVQPVNTACGKGIHGENHIWMGLFCRSAQDFHRLHARLCHNAGNDSAHLAAAENKDPVAQLQQHVKILAEGDDLEDAEEYDLTGSTEADMDLNRISDESPVGAALIGCKVGDSVDVTLPNGNIITYKLLEVSRSK